MFLHMFEDEQKDTESKNAISGASEPHSGLQFLTGSLLQLLAPAALACSALE